MLDDRKKKLLKLLVALAWADGRVDSEEMEVVEAMLDTFGADSKGGAEIRQWAAERRSFDDVDVSGLTEEDAELVLFQGVLLTFIDGEQSEGEKRILDAFVEKIGLSQERAAAVLETATARARDLLQELNS